MNQLSLFAKASLVSTCTAPVLFTYSFIAYTQNDYVIAALFTLATITLGVICVLVIRYFETTGHETIINVMSFKAADKEVSGFFVAYLIPLIGAGEYFYDLEQGIFFVSLFFIFIWASKSFYANPILGVFGYRFYELSTDSGKTLLLICRKDIENKKQISKIRYLTNYTVVTSRTRG